MKLTVIGAGPGGYEAAIYAAKQCTEVTLVEQNKVGGTCLNLGCIPTKSLLAASEALHTALGAKTFGIAAEGVTADYAAVAARKDTVVATLVKGVEHTLKANGVTLLQGRGQLVGSGAVQVTAADGTTQTLESDNILLATGSQPAVPGFLQPDGSTVVTSDEVLGFTSAPTSIIIVGGGVIGCEIGQFLARMGTAVTLVELLPHLLPFEDEDTAKALERQFRREKIKTLCGKGITGVEKTADGVAATLDDGTVLHAEKMLVAVGRKPFTQGLGLEAAGLATDEKGCVPVNGGMQTAAAGIYAIGDIVNTPQLAHVASKEGFCAVDNMLGKPTQMNYAAVPRCVYTSPEVAAVGETEYALQQKGIAYKTGRFDFIANGKAKAAGKTEGFCKVIASEADVLLGAAIVGAHATDMLGILTLAVSKGLTAAEVGDVIFPHPTMSEGIMEALHDVHGMSIHKV